MEKKNTKLIDKVISGLDWDSIFEVNKCFKIGVGEGTTAIAGVKRKVFSDELTKADIKSELKALLKYVIENDLAELYYGTWMIFWVNSEWIEIETDSDDLEDDQDNEIQISLEIDSTLEVIYSPQRICVVGGAGSNPKDSNSAKEDSDVNRLESMLKKALDSEKYELASKIRDILRLQKGDPSEDK
jgi:hypothetical protein